MKTFRFFVLTSAALLSIGALEGQTGRTHKGCWSPYPNCTGAKDIYLDTAGKLWNCGACGTYNPFSPTCVETSTEIYRIGYWCLPPSS